MLKYRIVVDHGFLLTCWHESNPNQFCYVTRRGCAAFIDFDFAYDFHDGIVLSIVGCKSLINLIVMEKINHVGRKYCYDEKFEQNDQRFCSVIRNGTCTGFWSSSGVGFDSCI